MIILGIYAGHDSHFCLMRDGAITHHYSAERFTRIKHAVGWRNHVLVRMFADAGVTWQDIDCVAVGGCRWNIEGSSELYNSLIPARDAFRASGIAQSFVNTPNRQEPPVVTVDVSCSGHAVKLYHIDHHLAHVSQAYYTSPFTDALAFSSDGGGDNAFMLSARGQGNRLSDLQYGRRPSIGNIWTWVVTELYRYTSLDGEGKVMGHAAYGTPRPEFCASIERLMRQGFGNVPFIQKELAWARQRVDFSDFHAQATKDYSASIQHVTEKITREFIDGRVAKDDVPNIALSGGCAYNCVANGKLAETYPNMHVANAPHDGGLAVGACLFVWHHIMGNPFDGVEQFDPFRGTREATASVGAAEQVVDDLLAGKLVAWFDGAAENGNRALGHRSILADPRDPTVRDRLNNKVKRREWYRPFAPSVLAGQTDWCPVPVPRSWYMSFAVPTSRQFAEQHPGVVHVDGTTRPHIVTQDMNPTYHRIIELFHEATGCPMVLNTSFNIQEPIVETAADALATFQRSGLDALYLSGKRIARAD